MTVHEVVGAAGDWTVTLAPEIPDEILKKLGYFGHIVIVRGKVDVDQTSGSLLSKARYVGVFRAFDRQLARTLTGPGMVTWLGDEDSKGPVIEAALTMTNFTITQAVTPLIPPALRLGTIYPLTNPAARFTGKFQFQTMREALGIVCDAFGVEFRVNGDGTVDVGRQDQLYTANPDSIIVRRDAASGADLDLVALAGDFNLSGTAADYSTRVLLLGQKVGDGTTPDVTFATGSADAASVPYLDLFGNTIKIVRMISESGTPVGTVAQRAQLQLNRFNRSATSLQVNAEHFETEGNFRCGDLTFVYDPENGIVNAANERFFRGELLHPDTVRVNEVTWPVSEDHTVVFRTTAGEWLDLTRYVVWETADETTMVVGDLSKSLVNTGSSNPVVGRVNDGLLDGRTPGTPTGLTLSTSSTIGPNGVNTGVISTSWTAPTANTDGSVPASIDHYVVRYRWQGRAPKWQYELTSDLSIDLSVALGLPYDVAVAAVSASGIYSAYTATSTITTALDSVAPPAPADPTVTSYLGQLRIEYSGVAAGGGTMPSDANRVDVFVSSSSGFTPALTDRVSSLNPFAKGVAYATAPYGSTRYVKLIAYDHTGNASPATAQVSGVTVKASDGDIADLSVGKLTAGTMSADVVVSGRFATALTGARVEVNSLGFQKFDAAGSLLVSITGTDSLITGLFQTALTGRRTVMSNAAPYNSLLKFYADDGTFSQLGAFTANTGTESLQLRIPNAGTASSWNMIQLDKNEYTYLVSNTAQVIFGGYTASRSGAFQVNYSPTRGTASPDALPTTTQRFRLDFNDAVLTFGSGGAFYVNQLDSTADSSGQQLRFRITNTDSQWFWPATPSQAYFAIRPDDGVSRGSGMLSMHPKGAYGASIRYVANSIDGFSQRRLEVKDGGDATYLDVWGGVYSNASSRSLKRAITDFGGDGLAIVNSLRLRNYKRKPPKNDKGQSGGASGNERVELGVIVEEAPPEIVVLDENGKPAGIDQYAYTSVVAHAVQQLAARLDKLEKGKS